MDEENEVTKKMPPNKKENKTIDSIEQLLNEMDSEHDETKNKSLSQEMGKVVGILKLASEIPTSEDEGMLVILHIKDQFKDDYLKIYLSLCCEWISKRTHKEGALIVRLHKLIRSELYKQITDSDIGADNLIHLNSVKRGSKSIITAWIKKNNINGDNVLNNCLFLYTWVISQGITEDIQAAELIIMDVLQSELTAEKIDKKGTRIFEKILTSNKAYVELGQYAYFSIKTHKENEKLKEQLNELSVIHAQIVESSNSLEAEYNLSVNENNAMLLELSNMGEELSDLRNEIDSARNRIEYERLDHQVQIASIKESLLSQLTQSISMEISQTRDTLAYLNPNDVARVEKRLRNIEDILAGMRGQ